MVTLTFFTNIKANAVFIKQEHNKDLFEIFGTRLNFYKLTWESNLNLPLASVFIHT